MEIGITKRINPNDEKEQWYIFTFGVGQKHAGHYVKIYGTFWTAREKMFERYGRDWCWQYTEDEWFDWLVRKPPYIPAETQLEEIP